MQTSSTTLPTRPTVRAIAKGVVLGLTAVAIGGVTVAYATDDEPYTLTRDGIQLAQPFEANGHINARTDAGVTFNIHAEAKCITRTDAECAGKRNDVAQYIGATFIPWTVIGVPADSCVVWLQRSGANYHYGEHGEPAFCLTEEEPCPTETPSTPTPEPTQPSTDPTSTPDPSVTEPATTDPSTSPEPSLSPSPPTAPSSTPLPTTPSSTPVSTVPSTTYAAPPRPDLPAAAPTAATPTTAATAPDHQVLAATGPNLTPWWIALTIAGIAVGAWIKHLARPSKGDE